MFFPEALFEGLFPEKVEDSLNRITMKVVKWVAIFLMIWALVTD